MVCMRVWVRRERASEMRGCGRVLMTEGEAERSHRRFCYQQVTCESFSGSGRSKQARHPPYYTGSSAWRSGSIRLSQPEREPENEDGLSEGRFVIRHQVIMNWWLPNLLERLDTRRRRKGA
jgi:hypothetical protein